MPQSEATKAAISTLEESNASDNRLRLLLQTIGTFGVPAVLIMLYYFQVLLPEQQARRERERVADETTQRMGDTLHEVGRTMIMLVEQDRRRESATSEMLRIQSDQTRTMQEQTKILQQIMLDQRNGAWNQPKPGNHAVGVKPEE
jgi:hypothetical protein